MEKGEGRPNTLSRRDFLKDATLITTSPLILTACRRLGLTTEDWEIPKATKSPTFKPPETATLPEIKPELEISATLKPSNALEEYFYPALEEVIHKRRQEKAQKDPEYQLRVDRELNENRVNIVVLGSRDLLTDSLQIISFDLGKNEFKTIGIVRDTQAPEVSRYKNTTKPYKINQAYKLGGIPLAEKTLEDATGLSADLTFVVEMKVLRRAIEELFDNKLLVDLPRQIKEGRWYFPPGVQELTGEMVLVATRYRKPSDRERVDTQQVIIEAMLSRIKEELSQDPLSAADFVVRFLAFVKKEISSGAVETTIDFELIKNLGREFYNLFLSKGLTAVAPEFGFPTYSGGYRIKDESAGDPNDQYRLKAVGGDPNASDLISAYWFSSRQETKEFLLQDW